MSLPDHLETIVTIEDYPFTVSDDRLTGESDHDFAQRHGRHILAVVKLFKILLLTTSAPALETAPYVNESSAATIDRHIAALPA